MFRLLINIICVIVATFGTTDEIWGSRDLNPEHPEPKSGIMAKLDHRPLIR